MTAWTTAMVCFATLWPIIKLYEKRDYFALMPNKERRVGARIGVAIGGAMVGAWWIFSLYGVACWMGWWTP